MTGEPLIDHFKSWLASLKPVSANEGPARGTIAGALVVLEKLKTNFTLRLEDHLTPGKAQVSGASGKNIKDLLATFGEHRPYLREGGRTNRGLPKEIGALLSTIDSMPLREFDEATRTEVLREFQAVLVEQVRLYHSRQRLDFAFDPSQSTYELIAQILRAAREAR
ncbi:MAG: DUF4928 family protein, partial [Opitutaceae bacterium]